MPLDFNRPPDEITAFDAQGIVTDGVRISAIPADGKLPIVVAAPDVPLTRIRLRWHAPAAENVKILGDAWERGYGDLEWRGLVAERVMPWYFLEFDAETTSGIGVETGANALCCWQRDAAGVTLWLDVRNGGRDVVLGEREFLAATVIVRNGVAGESPFAAASQFCRQLCPNPRLPNAPIYGGNNWYYAYGSSSHEEILTDAKLIAECAPPDAENRPWMVIDAGWTPHTYAGPWRVGNPKFPDMAALAAQIRALGVRPGLWTRPLLTTESLPDAYFFPADRFPLGFEGRILDPTVPDALAHIAEDIQTMTGWGYELVKHDFSTFDLLGRWGFEMGREMTNSNWGFSDGSKTTAEVVKMLYETLRKSAGEQTLLIGCNTIGHLGAGIFEIQRTGDDTSGKSWERTRRMGINTLAFRMPQHDAFFAVDADCVGLTNDVPWKQNRQWMDLLARSGTPLFVSAAPEAIGPEQRAALKAAFAAASKPQSPAEPLDWLTDTCPRRWRLNGDEISFDWYDADGVGEMVL